ncbi:MAG TPA: response regulator, partial [Bacteroidales bacterium]|nr:response regulator [Bacteroidales bacterium]
MSDKKKILIIEDNQKLLSAISRALEKAGYVVHEANTLKKGKEFFLKENPDLLVIDIVLPDGSGLDLAKEIANTPGSENKPFILMSGEKTNPSDDIEDDDFEAVDFLSKPFSMTDLVSKTRVIFAVQKIERRRIENEKRVQQRELSEWEIMSGSDTTVTQSAYEVSVLSDPGSDLVKELSDKYAEIIKRAVEARIYKTGTTNTDLRKDFAERLGFLKAGPKDLVRIHSLFFSKTDSNISNRKLAFYHEEARFVLLEIMGYLVTFYRN